jgi:hypothetical protein
MPKQKREQMGKKGRKFVTNNFNRKKLAEDLMNTLKQKH